jgi:hypothetical protein
MERLLHKIHMYISKNFRFNARDNLFILILNKNYILKRPILFGLNDDADKERERIKEEEFIFKFNIFKLTITKKNRIFR